ncbi:MAG TPA: hypothetical protein VE782_09490, partial [Myxococcaceae bacterium]|nr:hypothetical protein [Myxococcaceae bacterium]
MHFSKTTAALAAAATLALLFGCDGELDPGSADATSSSGSGQGGWVLQHVEDFEQLSSIKAPFAVDPVPQDGPFADAGEYFRRSRVTPPREAYRASAPFGDRGWLTAESYTRSSKRRLDELASVVSDPADNTNHVLSVRSIEHTDGTVIRSSEPLPSRYRISLRVGYADFGDGRPGRNGYDSGNERAEPWSSDDA